MINYYEKLKKLLTDKDFKTELKKLEKLDKKGVDIIKMYNKYFPKKSTLAEEKVEKVDILSGKLYKLKNKIQPAFYNKIRTLINAVNSEDLSRAEKLSSLEKAEELLNRVGEKSTLEETISKVLKEIKISSKSLNTVTSLSSAEYQKAKTFKNFDTSKWKWNPDQQLYVKK
jgi:hypothetical protein